MDDDVILLERIRTERNIERLRSLFMKTVTDHESQLSELHESHSVQLEMLHQQLSDANAAVSALKNQIKQMKEMHESDLDLLKSNERRLQTSLKAALSQSSERSRRPTGAQEPASSITADFLSLQEKNASLVAELARCKEDNVDLLECIRQIGQTISKIGKDNHHIRKVIVTFVDATRESLQLARQATEQSCGLARTFARRLSSVRDGLSALKVQVHRINALRARSMPSVNLKGYKAKLIRKFADVLTRDQRRVQTGYILRQRESTDNTTMIAERGLELLTSLRLMAVSTSSTFAIFVRFWEKNISELKISCMDFARVHASRYDEQRQRLQRKLKAKEQEIRRLADEVTSVKTARDLAREKIRTLSTASPVLKKRPTPVKKRSISTLDGLSQIKAVDRVNVATQSGLINMTLIRDRTIRHSKEAELSVLQSELDRAREQNRKLLEQMGGLRRIVRRAGESATDESGKNRQTIDDLETQLREEKRLLQRKASMCLRLQRDNEELAHAASKVEPLKKCLVGLFTTCQQRLEPLIAEQAIPDDLTELDELAQELFQVPIHKICNPMISRGFLKKQERKLYAAITEGIEVQEVESVFETLIDELQKRTRGARGDRSS
jgi:chromosome segregation ATPase